MQFAFPSSAFHIVKNFPAYITFCKMNFSFFLLLKFYANFFSFMLSVGANWTFTICKKLTWPPKVLLRFCMCIKNIWRFYIKFFKLLIFSLKLCIIKYFENSYQNRWRKSLYFSIFSMKKSDTKQQEKLLKKSNKVSFLSQS
jgi:hypothetical protein